MQFRSYTAGQARSTAARAPNFARRTPQRPKHSIVLALAAYVSSRVLRQPEGWKGTADEEKQLLIRKNPWFIATLLGRG